MKGINSNADLFGGSAMEFSTDEGNTNSTYTEPNLLYFISTHQAGKTESSNQTDSFIEMFNTPNDTIQDHHKGGVTYPPEMIVWGAICSMVLDILAIMGNFISIFALSRCKKLRNVTTAFVVNLCVANFSISCCSLASSIIIYKTQHWNGGSETCKFYYILIFFFAAGGMFTIDAITLNRYVLIVHPQFYKRIYCMRNTIIMLVLLWGFTTVWILLPYFDILGSYGYDSNSGECAVIDHHKVTKVHTFIVKYFIPLILFTLCYAKIFYVVRKIERKSSRQGNIISYLAHLSDKYWQDEPENESSGKRYKHLHNQKERRLFQIIMVIFLCFILCYIPVALMKMLRIEKEYPGLYIICHQGIHLSHVLNPVIYIVMSEEYRKAYKELFRCKTENH